MELFSKFMAINTEFNIDIDSYKDYYSQTLDRYNRVNKKYKTNWIFNESREYDIVRFKHVFSMKVQWAQWFSNLE